MINPRPLWDFNDAAASEARFTQAAEGSPEPDRSRWLTQVARAQGLQGRFAEGHATLDALQTATEADDELAVRLHLERGRLLRSTGEPASARPEFEAAVGRAQTAGLGELELDAWHMVALVAPPEQSNQVHLQAIERARAATDPAARNWDASLLNNLGMNHTDAGDFAGALPIFEQAFEACRRIGDPDRTRVARWMIAWTLRNLGRRDEALAIQRELKAEVTSSGADPTHVDAELALLGSD